MWFIASLGIGVILGWSLVVGANVPPVPEKFHAVLKSKEVNWRKGPGPEHAVIWTYRCPGWPVVIRKSWEQWCYIQDAEGALGWVHVSLLRFRHHALILQDKCPLRSSPQANATIWAYLRKGVIGRVMRTKDGWLFLSIPNTSYKGWVPKSAVWDPIPEVPMKAPLVQKVVVPRPYTEKTPGTKLPSTLKRWRIA